MADREYILQRNLCIWLSTFYPEVYYRSDLGGVRLNMGQAIKARNIQKFRGHPDFAIFEQSSKYPALFLELKDKQTDVFLKRGGVPQGNAIHLIEQAVMILMLRDKGFAADITIGQAQAEQVSAKYLSGNFSEADYTLNVAGILQAATDEQIRQAQAGHPVVFDYVKIKDRL